MTDIKDLVYVKRSLRTPLEWERLGLYLGVTWQQLKRIENEQQGDVDYCIMEMLVMWLQMMPNASWSTLKTALKKIGEDKLADAISIDSELEWSSCWLYIVGLMIKPGIPEFPAEFIHELRYCDEQLY